MSDPPHPLSGFIHNLGLRSPLDGGDRAAILALPWTVRLLDPSAYIVREGDPPTRCGVLVSGYAYRQKQTREGNRQIVAIHIPGEPLDVQHLYLDVADHSVQMLTRGEVAFVSRADLQALALSHAAITRALMMNVLVDASIFREWVLNVGRRDARTRMSHLLCEFFIRMQAAGLAGGDVYELPINQEQLADALGLTPVHVNRTLKALEAEGVIQRRKRSLAFPSWDKLREAADFNARYLHLPSEA
jgi:CRP-like cAMP-binding protein